MDPVRGRFGHKILRTSRGLARRITRIPTRESRLKYTISTGNPKPVGIYKLFEIGVSDHLFTERSDL